jgi:hypothetical protein
VTFTCCVCGNGTKAKEQWWNRDRGYGLCGDCAAWLKARPDYDPQEFTSYYGHEGVHWMPKETPLMTLDEFWAMVEEQTGRSKQYWRLHGYDVRPCTCSERPCPKWKLEEVDG